MNDNNTIELVEKEQRRLCDLGFHFTVVRKVKHHPKGIRRFLEKATIKEETLTFTVYQPTLNTLDRMTPYMLRFQKYEDRIREVEESQYLDVAKSSIVDVKNMAKLVAIMVMGEDYYIYDKGHYKRDDVGLERIEEILLNHVTPSKLLSLCEACLSVANLADFTNSIRLMAAEAQAAVKPRKNRVD